MSHLLSTGSVKNVSQSNCVEFLGKPDFGQGQLEAWHFFVARPDPQQTHDPQLPLIMRAFYNAAERDRVLTEAQNSVARGGPAAAVASAAGYEALKNVFAPLSFDWYLGEPVACIPCEIGKPWGKEVWYTGIEARGESAVRNERGQAVPLSLFLGALGEDFFAKKYSASLNLPLLKKLVTFSDGVLGSLYTEVHQQKNEVYICTQVCASVWPSGTGCLKFGISKKIWDEQGNSFDTWKERYRCALKHYEAVRYQVDCELAQLAQQGLGKFLAELSTTELQNLRLQLPADLLLAESLAAKDAGNFLQDYPLKAGSIALIPQGVPHSLQGGLHVIEFQTPTYERLIVSFAQKVQTQQGWDIDAALDAILPMPSLATPFVEQDPASPVQRIVNFSDVVVDSVHYSAAASYLKGHSGAVAYCMGDVGIQKSGKILNGEAWLIPAQLSADFCFVAHKKSNEKSESEMSVNRTSSVQRFETLVDGLLVSPLI